MPEDVNDNVLVKNGNSGGDDYTVSTDYAAVNGVNGHVQYMKLVDGTNGGATVIPGSSQGLFVVPRQDVQRIEVTSAGLTTATTAYAAGDTAGTEFEITNAARVSGGTGSILGVSLVDYSGRIGSVDIVYSRAALTSRASDNAAFTMADASMLDVIDIVSLNYAVVFPTAGTVTGSIARLMGLSIPYNCAATSLFASIILRTVPTSNFFTAVTDLKLITWVARD